LLPAPPAAASSQSQSVQTQTLPQTTTQPSALPPTLHTQSSLVVSATTHVRTIVLALQQQSSLVLVQIQFDPKTNNITQQNRLEMYARGCFLPYLLLNLLVVFRSKSPERMVKLLHCVINSRAVVLAFLCTSRTLVLVDVVSFSLLGSVQV